MHYFTVEGVHFLRPITVMHSVFIVSTWPEKRRHVVAADMPHSSWSLQHTIYYLFRRGGRVGSCVLRQAWLPTIRASF